MKNLIFISFLFFSSFIFGQANLQIKESKDSLITNNIETNKVYNGEESLIIYLNKMSDEQLLKLLKEQLIIGEIVYKETPKKD